MRRPIDPLILVLAPLLGACDGEDTPPDVDPAGREQTTESEALETGAELIQDVTPVEQIDVYLVGFHPSKSNPSIQMESHHYCHPHNYEILSGQLVGPGLPDAAEHELMEGKMNSYGKTWHVWLTGVHGRDDDPMPLGAPHLAWSFNRDGEALPGLVEARDRRMGIDTQEKRGERRDLADQADPQEGVDALRDAFPETEGRPPGVVDAAEASGSDDGSER